MGEVVRPAPGKHYVETFNGDEGRLLLFGHYNPSMSELVETAKEEFPDTPLEKLWVWNTTDGLYLTNLRQYPSPDKQSVVDARAKGPRSTEESLEMGENAARHDDQEGLGEIKVVRHPEE